ncbi:MAG: DUF448 domain-containing protein, partial [Candidatus Binataceae bacterium]
MRRDEQQAMARIAMVDGKLVLDFDRAVPGRGGYLHPLGECLERFATSKAREFRSLKRKFSNAERARIV